MVLEKGFITIFMAEVSVARVLSVCMERLEEEWSFRPIKKTPWSESASELYRPSDRRLSAK
jgi:hypothetical protein